MKGHRVRGLVGSGFQAKASALLTPPLRPFVVMVMVAILTASESGGVARAGILYWDTDGSTASNNASTGVNLGGSGLWSTGDANWWNTSLGTPQVWTDGSDAVFWGAAGDVSVSTVSANSLAFKTTGYSLDSGLLTLIGAASFTVDTGVVVTINSTLAGTNTLWKLGPGTLILPNTDNLNTATTNGGGTLRISADGCLGASLPDEARNTVTDIQFNPGQTHLNLPNFHKALSR